MALSNDLISQFVKITQNDKQTNKESTAYGKIVKQGDVEYVQLDGSDLLTPIESTTVVKDGDRVIVTIKNHTAIVTGDFTNPSANDEDVKEIGSKISEFEIVIADKISTEQLEAEVARIDKVIADNVTATNAKFETIEGKVADIDTIKADVIEVEKKITAHEGEFTTIRGELADFKDLTAENFDATNATIHNLEADYAEFKQATVVDLEAVNADIDNLEADYATFKNVNAENFKATNADIDNLEAEHASFKETTTDKLNANEATITELETKKLDAESAKVLYANIDFSNIQEAAIEKLFTDSGIIKDLIMSDGKVTGELVGVTIKGDLIEGNTLKADKLVILGEDGLYYKLNVNSLGETTASSDEKYQNGLDGSVIIAKSITADRVAVTDLVAFGATIGGFNITDKSIYSGAKASATNTLPGIYQDKEGQFAVGNDINFVKFYKDQNGQFRLEISADTIAFGSEKKTLDSLYEAVNANSEDLTEYIEATNKELESLQGQIDGSIMTWFYEYVPTNNNLPASEWKTTDLKNNHLGDLFYDTITGYCYRWQVQNNQYSWNRITDVDVTKALADAKNAQDTADNKRRVFVNTPTTPYDVGDLWVQGTNGDIMRCKTAKTKDQSYASADWVKASKYTDDTAVNALGTRVTEAETKIKQNSEDIELRATKTEVANEINNINNNLTDNYYNKTETDAKIQIESDKISQTVSKVETVERNAIVSSVEEFYSSISPTELIDGSWDTIQPEWINGRYIWRRTLVTKGDGTTSYQPNQNGVCITGNDGQATLIKDFEGEYVHLTDSGDYQFEELSMNGKTSQKTRSGKNKFDRDKVKTDKPNNIELNATGITLTNCWALEIMTNENVLKDFKPNTTYTCIAKVKVVSKPTTLHESANHERILMLYNSNASGSQQKTILSVTDKNDLVVGTIYDCRKVFNTPEDLTGYNLLAYNYYGNNDGGATYAANGSFEITELMILEGDVTDEDFELYGVSPSRQYPSEIENIEGDIEVKAVSENFFNKSDTFTTGSAEITELETGIRATLKEAGNYRYTKYKIPNSDVLLGKTLVLASKITASAENTGRILIYSLDANGNLVKKHDQLDFSGEKEVIMPSSFIENETQFALLFYANVSGTCNAGDYVDYTDVILKIKDNNDNTYKPHQEQTETFSLTEGEKLYKGSYLADDGKHHKRKQTVFNGTENWVLRNVNSKGIATYSLTGILSNYKKDLELIALCNYFSFLGTVNGATEMYKLDVGFSLYYNTTSTTLAPIYVNSTITTLDDFKSDLATKYANGTPVIVEYELAEEETVPYTEEQQEQWNNIKALTTYKKVTNIFSNNDLKPIFYGKYYTYDRDDFNVILNHETTDIRTEIQTNTTNILQDTQNIIFEALEECVKTGDFESYKEIVSTQFKQTSEDFTFLFNNALTEINNVNEETNTQFQEIQKYIRFVDGNIILGEVGNEITLKIQNDKISFLQNNIEVAYFSNNKLYVTDGKFLNSLQLGNFAFLPRDNGSLSFGKVGG